MSATPKQTDNSSTTSPDLASRHSDVNQTTPIDVKEEDTLNDKADDTESLTLDSLEEDDEDLKPGQSSEERPSLAMQSGNADVTICYDDVEGKDKQNCTKTDNSVSSYDSQGWNGSPKLDHVISQKNTNSSSNSRENDDSEVNEVFTGTVEAIRKSESVLGESGTSQTCEQNSDRESEVESCCGVADETNTKTVTSSSSCIDSAHSVSQAEAGMGKPGIIRRPQSLSGDSTSMSSRKNLTRSGIPRRKLFNQSSGNHGHGSTKSTPVHSPHSLQRSLTLNSADVEGKSSFSRSEEADLIRKSSQSLRTAGVDLRRKSPSCSRPGNSGGLKKNPSGSGPRPADEIRKSPSSPCSVDFFPVRPFCVSSGQTASWDPGNFERRGSLCETMSVLSTSSLGISGHASRDTITSRLRIEKQHQDHDLDHDHDHPNGPTDMAGGGPRTYLTPSQRKDLTIRELKAQVFHLTRQLEERELQLQEVRVTALEEQGQMTSELHSQLEEARALAETARKEVTSLRESHEESVKTVAVLQQQLEDVKKEMTDRLAQAEEIFLEMYKKGRESAIFEREEELELQGKGTRSMNATEAELRNKLMRTQAELAKWQTIQRNDSYHATPLPATEAETTLAFLKDSMFHFLTAEKTQTGDEHLRAVVRILMFSQDEREKIAQAILTKRNKSVL